ncbi:MAG: ABC transporter permease [Deinococcota bacterium]|jgi:peptide/nickel transport system permease protein|nr:ABC transporter permease [Deinococcota bacterium]
MTAPAKREKGRSLAQDAVRRFFRNPTGLLGLSVVVFFILISLLAPLVSPYDAQRDRNLRLRLTPPSWTMTEAEREGFGVQSWSTPFGTDELGRNLLTRVWHGGRISLRVGLVAVAIAVTTGTLLGLMAGYLGGWVDTVTVWLVDILLAFPGILLAIAIVATLGPSLSNALIAISITQIPVYIRITRAVVLGLRESEYVQAAKALGAKSPRVVFAHILPNALSPLIVQLTLSVGVAILDVAALGFLGLGAQPPNPEWGVMIRDGYRQFLRAPWMSIFPGLAIFFSVVGFNLLGDAIRDALDPRLKNA